MYLDSTSLPVLKINKIFCLGKELDVKPHVTRSFPNQFFFAPQSLDPYYLLTAYAKQSQPIKTGEY